MDNKPDLYFKYKDKSILLEDTCEDSNDPTIQEFNSILEDLNLKYSYAKLFHLTHEQLDNYPISLVYKGVEYSLKKFVDEYKNLSKELSLANVINGFEANHSLEMIQLSFSDKSKEGLATCIETFRLFQDVYNTFSLARFALLDGFMKLHLQSVVTWKSGASGQFWLRTYYLNNAIIWYNSCFDILLQTLWIGMGYYKNHSITFKDLCTDIDNVLSKCRYNKIPDDVVTDFYNSDVCKKVKDKANAIKHRNGLRFKELVDSNLCWYNLGEYDSLKTASSTDMEEVIHDLKDYHKAFLQLIEKVKTIINNEFTDKYNIQL